MKLIFCPECRDIVKLRMEPRNCLCGKSGGRYNADGDSATIWGASRVLAISNAFYAKQRDEVWWYDENNGKSTRLEKEPI